jgi:hypothetical protein
MSSAVQNILNTVNKQLQAVIPDAAAIMRAGSGIGTAALAGFPGVKKNDGGGVSTETFVPVTGDEALGNLLVGLRAAADRLREGLAAPVPSFNSDSCKVADLPATAAMASNAPASIEMKIESAALNYKVTGGSGFYTASWKGATPAGVDATMQADTLKIFVNRDAKASDFADQSYELDVYDSTPGTPKHLPDTIKVKTVKAAAPAKK